MTLSIRHGQVHVVGADATLVVDTRLGPGNGALVAQVASYRFSGFVQQPIDPDLTDHSGSETQAKCSRAISSDSSERSSPLNGLFEPPRKSGSQSIWPPWAINQ